MSDLPDDWRWKEIRQDCCDPKEPYYGPYARQRNVDNDPHGGRGPLAKEAAAHYPRIRRLCPEGVAALEDRIRTALAAG